MQELSLDLKAKNQFSLPSCGNIPHTGSSVFPLPVRPANHGSALGLGLHTCNYPSPPMSNSPSPSRRFHPITSASFDSTALLAPPPPQDQASIVRRDPPGMLSLPPPGHYQPVQSYYPPPSNLPSLGQTAPMDRSHYFPQRAAIPRGGIAPIVQTEIGGAAASAIRGARSSRRGKSHVQKACVNCKKAHLSCDAQRPCARCVGSGKQDTCHDVEHKKRGRPRLRDDRNLRIGRELAAAGSGAFSETASASSRPGSSYTGHRKTLSGRILRSQPPSFGPLSQPIFDPRARPSATSSTMRAPSPPCVRVYTNMDFRILRASHAFIEQFARGADVLSRPIGDFIDRRHEEDLHQLQRRIREQRHELNPMALPPIFSDKEQEAVQAVNENELDRYLVGPEFQESWLFSLPGLPPQTRGFTIRLGRAPHTASTYDFVVFSLPSFSAFALPPLPRFGAPQQLPPGGVPPSPWEPHFQQRSPTSFSAGAKSHSLSGPATPHMSLQSLASSLPPSHNVPAYGLSSSPIGRYDPASNGYFPDQPRNRPISDPTSIPAKTAPHYVHVPPVPPIPANFPPPPPTPSSTTSAYSHRPLSVASEPLHFGTGARSSMSGPAYYSSRPRTYSTISTGATTPRSSRLTGSLAGVGEKIRDEEEDARKRRRLDINAITD